MRRSFLLLSVLGFFITSIPMESIGIKKSETGIIKGVMKGSDSNKTIVGATIILCRIVSEGECIIQTKLSVSTDEEGRFSFSSVPVGNYVVLYNVHGMTDETKESADGLSINYRLGREMRFGSMMTKEFYDTFGGGMAVTVNKGTIANLFDGKMNSLDGSFTSRKYGFTIDFHDGKPLMIDVTQGESVEIEINAWGL